MSVTRGNLASLQRLCFQNTLAPFNCSTFRFDKLFNSIVFFQLPLCTLPELFSSASRGTVCNVLNVDHRHSMVAFVQTETVGQPSFVESPYIGLW